MLQVLLLPPVSHTMSLFSSTVVAVKDSVDIMVLFWYDTNCAVNGPLVLCWWCWWTCTSTVLPIKLGTVHVIRLALIPVQVYTTLSCRHVQISWHGKIISARHFSRVYKVITKLYIIALTTE